jgi:DNA-binding GntR family transcriptional regulator
VERNLLSRQIADMLRRDIFLGVVKPGTHLSQQQLTDQFGVSRMPIRDALRSLIHEGLLVTDAASHTIVAPLSRDDLRDAYLVEGTLVGLAAERASRNASDTDVDRLDGMHRQIEEATRVKDYHRLGEMNWNFHRNITRLAASRKLLTAIKTVSLDLPRGLTVEAAGWADESNRDHQLIIDALRARKHAQVRKLMTDHIVRSGDRLISYLEGHGLQLD